MTAENFCYWLQGWFEINGEIQGKDFTTDQLDIIQRHLNMVFIHDIDPKMGDAEHQQKLNKIHSKPTLQELLPDHNVINSDIPLSVKPKEWQIHWKHGPHGWYDPKFGVPRC